MRTHRGGMLRAQGTNVPREALIDLLLGGPRGPPPPISVLKAGLWPPATPAFRQLLPPHPEWPPKAVKGLEPRRHRVGHR